MSGMRLQKFLSTAGICSRRKGEELISSGKVRVNGKIVTELGAKVDPDVDFIEVDGQTAAVRKKYIYIALNKPKEYVTSCKHPGERIVLELVDIPERIYPIGRLDKDSTGLLLLTNDGRMHYQLTHPSFDHEKEYEVTVAQPITDGALRKMAEGVPMMAGKTRPSRIQRLSARRFRIVLKEGKNRQIRRMVRKMGNQVTGLHRIRVAEIRLGGLAPGDWRHLTEKEKLGLSKMR